MEFEMDSTENAGAAIQVRVEGPIFSRIENWRRSQSKIPPRSEALRQLVERGLEAAEQSATAAA
jgi:hypothetical protein